MTSFADNDVLMDELFVFDEIEAFALPLLDFDTLLTPAKLAMGHTHLPQTKQTSFSATASQLPTSPDSTDADVFTPSSALQQQSPCSFLRVDGGSFAPTHSPLSTGHKLLAPRTSNNSFTTSPLIETAESMQLIDKTQLMPVSDLFPDALPYAMPVVYSPRSFDANDEQPFTGLLRHACGSVSSSATDVVAATDNNPRPKKSKREIRQMKNRESANKSHLYRKGQLTTLKTKVTELKKHEQEMQTIITSLRAENKSLLDQNRVLRSLVTGCKQTQLSTQYPRGCLALLD